MPFKPCLGSISPSISQFSSSQHVSSPQAIRYLCSQPRRRHTTSVKIRVASSTNFSLCVDERKTRFSTISPFGLGSSRKHVEEMYGDGMECSLTAFRRSSSSLCSVSVEVLQRIIRRKIHLSSFKLSHAGTCENTQVSPGQLSSPRPDLDAFGDRRYGSCGRSYIYTQV